MTNKAFAAWCKAATEKIRYGPDREAVSAELQAHLEDKYDAFLAQGLTHEEATARTLEDMGSAGEIAPQLGAIHRPWLGYLYRVTQLIAITVLVPAMLVLGGILLDKLHIKLSIDHYESLSKYDDTGYYCKPNVCVYTEGYRISIPEAAVVPEEQRLYFELEVHYWPWMGGFTARDHFWAVDSLGNYYCSIADYDYESPRVNSHGGGIYSSGIQAGSYTLEGFDCDAQWVELHYDRDGRDIVLRIDLTGGDVT